VAEPKKIHAPIAPASASNAKPILMNFFIVVKVTKNPVSYDRV
jgi:hypothetical protein